jgi:hypothetical protein
LACMAGVYSALSRVSGRGWPKAGGGSLIRRLRGTFSRHREKALNYGNSSSVAILAILRDNHVYGAAYVRPARAKSRWYQAAGR